MKERNKIADLNFMETVTISRHSYDLLRGVFIIALLSLAYLAWRQI